jgi:hypothetical protein
MKIFLVKTKTSILGVGLLNARSSDFLYNDFTLKEFCYIVKDKRLALLVQKHRILFWSTAVQSVRLLLQVAISLRALSSWLTVLGIVHCLYFIFTTQFLKLDILLCDLLFSQHYWWRLIFSGLLTPCWLVNIGSLCCVWFWFPWIWN